MPCIRSSMSQHCRYALPLSPIRSNFSIILALLFIIVLKVARPDMCGFGVYTCTHATIYRETHIYWGPIPAFADTDSSPTFFALVVKSSFGLITRCCRAAPRSGLPIWVHFRGRKVSNSFWSFSLLGLCTTKANTKQTSHQQIMLCILRRHSMTAARSTAKGRFFSFLT